MSADPIERPQMALIFTAKDTFIGRIAMPVIDKETARVGISRDAAARWIRDARNRKMGRLTPPHDAG